MYKIIYLKICIKKINNRREKNNNINNKIIYKIQLNYMINNNLQNMIFKNNKIKQKIKG